MTTRTRLFVLASIALPLCLTGRTPASAEVVSNDRLTLPFAAFDACNGELIFGTTDVHIVRTVQQKGDCQEFGLHLNLEGTATGAVSGNPYVIHITDHESQIVCLPCAGELVFYQKSLLISMGPLPNQVVTISFTCPLREVDGLCILDCKKPEGQIECQGPE
jgi:hypothetical protein